MNKMQIGITFFVIAIFIGIIIVTQSGTVNKNITQVPTLPPESSTFKLLSPTSPQQQQVQGQQTQQNQDGGGAAPTFGVEEGVKASSSGIISTTKGDIHFILSGRDAPRTVKNFITKIKSGFYKNLTFHRVEDWVVQGGDPKGDGTGGGLMQTEINNLAFSRGSIGVARGSNIGISNDAQFFITKIESPQLNQQYTNFGLVTTGMENVDRLVKGDRILGITIGSEN